MVSYRFSHKPIHWYSTARNHKESHPTRVVNAHLRLQTPCVAWHPWPPWPGISQSGWISVDIRSLPWISGEIKPNSYHRITETKTKTTPGLSCTSTPTNHTCISIYIYIIYIYLYTKYWVAVPLGKIENHLQQIQNSWSKGHKVYASCNDHNPIPPSVSNCLHGPQNENCSTNEGWIFQREIEGVFSEVRTLWNVHNNATIC
jgi:hypothetical protein